MSQIPKIMRNNLSFYTFLISGDSSIISDDKDFEGSGENEFGKNVKLIKL